MSNFRIFCYGYLASAIVRMLGEFLGWPESAAATSQPLLAVLSMGITFGVAAVAMFGDRQRQPSPTSTDGMR